MHLVIQVMDNQVSSIGEHRGADSKAKAVAEAVKIIKENEIDRPEAGLAVELEKFGTYIPAKHPEWSVSVYEVVA